MKNILVNVSVKVDEERMQKAIETFKREVSECFSVEVGSKSIVKDISKELAKEMTFESMRRGVRI